MVTRLEGRQLTRPEKIVYEWYREAATEAGVRLAEVIHLRQRCAVLESAGATFDERTKRLTDAVVELRASNQIFKEENDRLRRSFGPDGRPFWVRPNG